MNPSQLIILGSSRSHGDTRKVVDYIRNQQEFDLLDLNGKNISYYDYESKNQHDDFLPTMEDIVSKYQTIIFATPVYWYSMSAVMKTFFDRISDLLRIRKEVGRKLRGMNMAMLSCSNGDDRILHFEMPFIESAKYLGMNYLGDVHTWLDAGNIPEEVKSRINQFLQSLPND